MRFSNEARNRALDGEPIRPQDATGRWIHSLIAGSRVHTKWHRALTDNEQFAFIQHYVYGHSVTKISKELGLSSSRVSQLMRRCGTQLSRLYRCYTVGSHLDERAKTDLVSFFPIWLCKVSEHSSGVDVVRELVHES